mmetsp:Transcript_16360/g.52003  ORF Transcript_16360/g.52003 Transcript_16360/m.52003 type:complete len:733 (-) Transcript_16360:63-2261(-)
MEDQLMQSAIWASLKSASAQRSHSFSAPRSFGSGNSRPGPTIVRSSWGSPARTASSSASAWSAGMGRNRSLSPGHGRRGSLQREGIAPVPTSGVHPGAIYRGSIPRRSGLPPRGVGSRAGRARGRAAAAEAARPSARPSEPAAASSARSSPSPGWERVAMGGGWVEHRVRQHGVTLQKQGGSFQVCGLHTVLEGYGTTPFLCTREHRSSSSAAAALASGWFDLEAQVKCARSSDPGPTPPRAFHLVLAFRSPSDYLALVGDAGARSWRVERRRASGRAAETLCTAVDARLHPNAFVTVLVQARGNRLSLDADGEPVITDARVGKSEESLAGGVGVAAARGKTIVKNWVVTPAGGGSGAAPHSASASVAAPTMGAGASRVPPSPVRRQPHSHRAPRTPSTSTSPASAAAAAAAPAAAAPPAPAAGSIPPDADPALARAIERDVIEAELGVTFADIASLADAKRLLNEAVALPLLVPEFFTGIREPWKGVLLFGPPGTGKTMLAKAVAGMNGSTFFNCSASTLISKWRGESERLVHCLFALARHRAPSIVFIDEVDALMTARGGESEHEASRRMKAELLTQMDGLTSRAEGARVMVLATTNCPWDLDEALRRRLEKRIYIPLPDQRAREEMFLLNMKGIAVEDGVDPAALARATEGYSGADIHVVCREACYAPMRRLLASKSPADIADMRQRGELLAPPVLAKDFEEAMAGTRPSVSGSDLARFEAWAKEFASV